MEGTPGAQELHLVVGSHGLGQLEADLEITTHETERSHKIWVEVEVQAVVGGGGGAGGGGWRWRCRRWWVEVAVQAVVGGGGAGMAPSPHPVG